MIRRCAFFITVLFVASSADAQDDPCDPRWPGRAYPLGAHGSNMLYEDFDQDGDRDVVTIRLETGAVVRLERAGGDFAAPVELPTNVGAYARLAAGDLNGDGKVDVLATHSLDPSLAVAAGDGQGGFLPATMSAALPTYHLPVLADADNDGDLDALVRSHQTGDVEIRWNGGSGSFGAALSLTGVGKGGIPVATDFDADGDLDLALGVTNNSHAVIYAWNGAGFAAPQFIATPLYVWDVEVTDLGADGLPDLIAAGNQGLHVVRNLGGLAFAPPLSIPTIASPYLVEQQDVDGDGDLDLLLPGWNGQGAIAVHRRVGDDFLPATTFGMRMGMVTEIVVDDVLGDATPDVLVMPNSDMMLVVFEGDDEGSWFGHDSLDTTPDFSLSDLVPTHLDGDGHVDLVIVGGFGVGLGVEVRMGLDGLSFSPPALFPTNIYQIEEVAAADFDSDGTTDVFLTDGWSCEMRRGQGNGSFGPPSAFQAPLGLYGIAVSDLDLDGDLDVAGASFLGANYMIGDGAGGFQPSPMFAGTEDSTWAAVEDFDLDGVPDLAYARTNPYGLGVVFAPGTTSNPTVKEVGWGKNLRRFATGDVTDDGRPDLVAADFGGGQLVLVKGLAGGGLGPAEPHALFDGCFPSQVRIPNVDADGHEDVVVGAGLPGVATLRGDGIGGLDTARFTAVQISELIWLADLNGDEKLDLLSAGTWDCEVGINVGRPVDWWTSGAPGCPGIGGFTPSLSIPACSDPTVQLSVQLADAPGGAAALLLVGLPATSVPIGTSPCLLHLAPVVALPVALDGVGPGAGTVVLSFAVPPVALGLSFRMQSAIADPSSPGFTMTNALDFHLP